VVALFHPSFLRPIFLRFVLARGLVLLRRG
jgi:hypothetical protein